MDNTDKATTKKVLDEIESEALWLSHMVDNLLAMTRVQDDAVPLKMKNEVVDDILSEAISRTSGRKGSHELIVDWPETVLLVPMDGRLITQVLINLIDNAYKHTREDATVRVAVYEDEIFVRFAVTDNGGGVAQDRIGHLFDSFYTEAQGDSDSRSGMGLGLSICQSIYHVSS